MINITWNIPTVPNGVIIMYEIRYRESNSNGPYNMINTTNTQYSIGGLLPNTNYTIGVRAYTSVGPGEWSDTQISTSNIRRCVNNISYYFNTKNITYYFTTKYRYCYLCSYYIVILLYLLHSDDNINYLF